MKTCSIFQITRASGIFDIIIVLPFLIPGISSSYLNKLHYVHEHFNLRGVFPAFESPHLLFVNIMAAITVVWSLLRVFDPKVKYLVFDNFARVLIFSIITFYILYLNVSEIFLVFSLIEGLWFAIQTNAYFFKKTKGSHLSFT